MLKKDLPSFDPADLFGDDAQAGDAFTHKIAELFGNFSEPAPALERPSSVPDPAGAVKHGSAQEERRQKLLEKYLAAKAAFMAQRALSDRPLPEPGALPPLRALDFKPKSPSALPPLPSLPVPRGKRDD